jgi:hypothetical protein
MATDKPRVAVTLEPHRYALLKRLAELQGVSMSFLIADLLETVAGPLERVAVILEAARRAPDEVKAGLKSATNRAEANFLPAAAAALSQLDIFLSDSVVTIATGARSDTVSADPQPVITGVRSPVEKPAKPSVATVSADLAEKSTSHAKDIKPKARTSRVPTLKKGVRP